MILVDTSVWIDHIRSKDARLSQLLERGEISGHPFVTGEISLGNIKDRSLMIALMKELEQSVVATVEEVAAFIEIHALAGTGIGYVDAHLMVATALSDSMRLWTRDKRLRKVSEQARIAVDWD